MKIIVGDVYLEIFFFCLFVYWETAVEEVENAAFKIFV